MTYRNHPDNVPDDFDEDSEYQAFKTPCDECHLTERQHTRGCPNGDDTDYDYELALRLSR